MFVGCLRSVLVGGTGEDGNNALQAALYKLTFGELVF